MTEKTKAMADHLDAKQHVEHLNEEKGELFNEKEDQFGAVAKTDPAEIALVRKLDWRIMPTLWAMYFLNYLDRNAIAQARLDDLEDDLDLHGSQYNTAISILFVGYLLMQIPSNMYMSSKKVRPSLYMGTCMGLWAVVSACTALVHDYKGLVLVRFFLGVAEAPFYPGALFMLSLFYTRKEIATRISILYSGNILATAFSGLIAAAVFNTVDGAHGLAGWRWLFIIEGCVTLGVSILALFMLADHPLSTRWLTPEQRELAHARILRDTVSAEEDGGPRAGLMQAVRDPRLYLFCFMQNMHLSACGFNNFFPTVVKTLGFDSTVTLVLTCPPYLVSGAVGVLVGYTSGRYNERTWHVTAGMGAALVGFVVACATLNTAARYVACFLFASGAYAVNSVILGWVSATLGQTSEKKGVSLSVVNVVANASYIYTAYLYPDSDGPRYVIGMGANAGFAFATIASAWAMRVWLMRTNKKIKDGRLAGGERQVVYAY
ncbi:vitamin H transporter [Macrophomina phaseolina]|uniref:Vitamin H transporter n=1 Tax=Macrophomina phaseolina TaxID=35725 RepID=A0ABQ8G4U8_9PEZI|nr:vitamin H transporter [Macrophomina phaseolina]